jgi:glycerate kinase
MASALGWRFLDAQGDVLPDGGGALRDLHVIEGPPNHFLPGVRVMCDVTNPLLGEAGAAKVFGPQKGATADQVQKLEEGLGVLAERIRKDVGVEVSEISGGGAAGGIAAGAIAFLGAELVSGVNELLRLGRVEKRIRDADLVVTGEGRLDTQSLDGKVVSGILALAARHHVPVAVVAGDCALDPGVASARGIHYALSANDRGFPIDEAMRRAAELARNAGARLAERIQS